MSLAINPLSDAHGEHAAPGEAIAAAGGERLDVSRRGGRLTAIWVLSLEKEVYYSLLYQFPRL